MKLEELNLDVAGVVGAPVKITAPQSEWLQARSSGVIPESLFKLYEAAGYLSFGAAPKFLADPATSCSAILQCCSEVLGGSCQRARNCSAS